MRFLRQALVILRECFFPHTISYVVPHADGRVSTFRIYPNGRIKFIP